MNIVVGSAFRNSVHYLGRYFAQIDALRKHFDPAHTVRVIAVEGDSKDKTRKILPRPGVEVVTAAHGGPVYGSTEHSERMIALSKVGNSIFGAVKDTDDVLVYVESDLLWDPQTINSLIEKAITQEGGFDVFAPLIFAGQCFYDVWGFRKDGARFSPFAPYHSGMNGSLTEIDSAGSCLVMRSIVARECRIRNDYCLVGWCEDARAHGYRIAVCSDLRIHHP